SDAGPSCWAAGASLSTEEPAVDPWKERALVPTDWGGRSQEDHQSLPLNAELAGRPSATGCTQRTPRGVSVFPVGQVYPDGASVCLSYRPMLGGRREAGFCRDRCLVDVSPGWWPSVQASDLEATRLSTAWPGHHLPEAASLEGQPGPQDGPGPLLHSPPSLDGKQLQPSHGATCPQRGFGGHGAESEAFLTLCFQSFPESRKFLEWRAATRPFAAGISKLQGLFCS
ncbi:uncharacterized protein, partial [Delphinus delphis]|uniref:uncharacterized protein n=1 Tax=Delphinus delphis TaxID=9728 RepID=UPI003752958D